MTPPNPRLSVIVPAYNGARVLPRCLEALAASDLPRSQWELIVVDDGSSDETPLIAARHADLVVRLPGRPQGPAYARNRGAQAARGEVLVFIDADVCVHPDTLRGFARAFEQDPALAAVFGSYDANPPAPGTVSQYRNLLHHYHHQRNPGEAETFWAGCGAVRQDVFLAVGGFDEWHYPRPSIEDIELGYRIRERGGRIVLRPEIQCRHLKRWTLSGVFRTDLLDRGIPWMRLLLQEGRVGNMRALNLSTIERLNTASTGLAAVAFAASLVHDPRWSWAGLALVGVVLATNLPLYAFFRRTRGLAFALSVLPLHLGYYLLNGVSAAAGWLLHHLVGEPSPRAEVQAFAEVGVRTWPPVPARGRSSPWTRPDSATGR
jgi:hypothetical protein